MITSRLAAPDVLRGVAILGTFASNAWLFAHPGGPAGYLLVGAGTTGAVETALRLLSNGKFLALLTLLFGVGMELQYRSALRRGTPWPGRYLVRAGVLFTEGLLHYLLVFEFDVLMGYAVASVLVAYVIGRRERAWMIGVGVVYVAGLLGLTALLLLAPDGPAGPAAAVDTGSWPAQVEQRIALAGLFRVELLVIVPSAVVLFLAGARLLRAGVFDDTAPAARLRARLVGVGIGIGLPLNAVTAFAGGDWFLVDRYLLPPLVAFGLLGLVTELVVRFRGGPVRRGLAAVGRTALSCYVAQNVLASVLCHGWGLGLAARFDSARPWWVLGLWAATSALLMLGATAWLRHHDRGPLEMLARRAQRSMISQPP